MKNLIILLLFAVLAPACKKDKPKPKQPPTISSFTVSSTTMTTATFNFSVSNYTSLRLSIDGKVIDVSGGTFVVSGLNAGKSYTATLTASNADGSISSSQSFSTSKSSLSITSFKVTDTSWNGASFAFGATSDATITSQTLINNNTSISIDVSGKGGENVEGLMPDSLYTFTFKVKDDTQNEVSQSISFRTKKKVSELISITSITYDSAFAIIGNAVSSKLRIKVNAEKMMSLSSLTASFGEYGLAVKMLRYSLNGSPWVVLKAEDGKVNFKNALLASGENTFDCYFSLKPNVGVANGSALTFSITSMNDGEGGGLPKGGSFPSPLQVGSVNANTAPTIITTSWNGHMYINTFLMSPKEHNPNSNFSEKGLYQAIAIKATGPAGARFSSIKLKNPYSSFTALEFNNNSWVLGTLGGSIYYTKILNNFWQNDYVILNIPTDTLNNNLIYTDGITNNNFYIRCGLRNNSSVWFDSGNYTPGLGGLMLTSKYDLVLRNSDGQVIDLSEVVIKQGDDILQN